MTLGAVHQNESASTLDHREHQEKRWNAAGDMELPKNSVPLREPSWCPEYV